MTNATTSFTPKRNYMPPRIEVVEYVAECGFATSIEEEGYGFVRDGGDPENLVLLNSQGRTNQNERYEDINWNGFGDDGFWSE